MGSIVPDTLSIMIQLKWSVLAKFQKPEQHQWLNIFREIESRIAAETAQKWSHYAWRTLYYYVYYEERERDEKTHGLKKQVMSKL